MTSLAPAGNPGIALALVLVLALSGCSAPDNHLTLVEIPSGSVAGQATECGILALRKPVIHPGDLYPIRHVYRDGLVQDEARVVNTDEYLALLEPVSSRLNNVRFLLEPLAEDETLYVGVLDEKGDAQYLEAEVLARGAKGDFILCGELDEYPEPSSDGYGGVGLFAYRHGAMWLVGLLSPLRAEIEGFTGNAYPFIGMDKIWRFIPDLKDNFTRERKPFRPDFIHGVKRDGTGE